MGFFKDFAPSPECFWHFPIMTLLLRKLKRVLSLKALPTDELSKIESFAENNKQNCIATRSAGRRMKLGSPGVALECSQTKIEFFYNPMYLTLFMSFRWINQTITMHMLTKQKIIQSHFLRQPEEGHSAQIGPTSVKIFLNKTNLIPSCLIYWIMDERPIIWLQKKYESLRTGIWGVWDWRWRR